MRSIYAAYFRQEDRLEAILSAHNVGTTINYSLSSKIACFVTASFVSCSSFGKSPRIQVIFLMQHYSINNSPFLGKNSRNQVCSSVHTQYRLSFFGLKQLLIDSRIVLVTLIFKPPKTSESFSHVYKDFLGLNRISQSEIFTVNLHLTSPNIDKPLTTTPSKGSSTFMSVELCHESSFLSSQLAVYEALNSCCRSERNAAVQENWKTTPALLCAVLV